MNTYIYVQPNVINGNDYIENLFVVNAENINHALEILKSKQLKREISYYHEWDINKLIELDSNDTRILHYCSYYRTWYKS